MHNNNIHLDICLCSFSVFQSSFLCICVGQIVEYEDYDNTTNYYHVNEYEYEDEYDERYGPAERQQEFSLNAQVHLDILYIT